MDQREERDLLFAIGRFKSQGYEEGVVKIMIHNIHTTVGVAILIAASTVFIGAYPIKLSAARLYAKFAEQCYLAANSSRHNREKMQEGVRSCTLALRQDLNAKKARAQNFPEPIDDRLQAFFGYYFKTDAKSAVIC